MHRHWEKHYGAPRIRSCPSEGVICQALTRKKRIVFYVSGQKMCESLGVVSEKMPAAGGTRAVGMVVDPE